MEERDFYDERQETRKSTLNCPHCHQANEYDLGWLVIASTAAFVAV